MNENETPRMEDVNETPEVVGEPAEETVPAETPEVSPAEPEAPAAQEPEAEEAEEAEAEEAEEDEAEEPAPKKPFPIKLVGIVAAVVLVLGLIGYLVSAIQSNKPMKLITTALTKSETALKKNETYKELDGLLNGGSIGVQSDLSKLLEDIAPRLNVDADDLKYVVTGTLYMKLQDFFVAATGDVQQNKKEWISGTAVASLEYLAVSCDKVLGKTSYGISLKNLYKNIKGSIYDPAKDTDYAVSEKLYDYLVAQSDGYQKPLETVLKDGSKVWDEFLKQLYTQIEKNAEFSKDKDKIEVGGETISVKTVSLDMNDEDLAKVISELAKWAKSSKSFKSLLEEIIKYYGVPLSLMFGTDPDALLENIYEIIEEQMDAEEVEEKLGSTRIALTFYISKANKQLVQLDAKVKNNGITKSYSLSMGPDLAKPTEITLVQKTANGKKITLSYLVEENSSSQYTARLTRKVDTITTTKLSLSWSKKDGAFSVKESDSGFYLTGTMTQKSKTTTILLKKLDYGKVSISDLGSTITLNTSAKMPSLTKYTDLITMKDTALEKLKETVNSNIEDLLFDIK